ncbi:hypothetical protein LXD69_17715 [Flavobacterium sediminilitoris]|uniref:Bacteriocin-like protein n=1 Tax=Flavobacterium sediminilitoris TaxID=2024526 RepID=A0ABY4HMG0_9FLAO|nr:MULTISPECIES: hypothetical protein [Flavobacterium]UOX33858.1 hypothetical protein LXD69_17715 [Flavobacterium sediminilitoris]
MLELILKKAGVQKLNKKEKRTINGGLACRPDGSCPTGSYCETTGDFAGLCRRY